MNKSNTQYQKLPPGWDCKIDQATGNWAMQLEDPRMLRYKQLQNERSSTESIPMQPLAGGSTGSPYHVYPSNNLPAMRAFQIGDSNGTPLHSSYHNRPASSLLSSQGHLDMSMVPLLHYEKSQHTPLLSNSSRRSTIQETSFSNPIDTDAVVAKIQNMFPTASENHIRLLLKKYYNREAVVISALQVEKHPVTMPGPYVTPPAQRHLFHCNSIFHIAPSSYRPTLPMTGSMHSHTAIPIPAPVGGRRFSSFGSGICRVGNSPKPHASPKMKLRYMKNIFPKADEMLLLDILTGADDNVQSASEQLIIMGYDKREFSTPIKPNRAGQISKPELQCTPPPQPKEYNETEKKAVEKQLKEMNPNIGERIIAMALESVNYNKDRALQILDILVHEENDAHGRHAQKSVLNVTEDPKVHLDDVMSSGNSSNATAKAENKNSQRDSTDTNNAVQEKFESILGRIATVGHNVEYAKGADESLLLADYVTWNGANPETSKGHKPLTALGSDPTLLVGRTFAQGRNVEYYKGSNPGLAKGSIYAQLATGSNKGVDIKCN